MTILIISIIHYYHYRQYDTIGDSETTIYKFFWSLARTNNDHNNATTATTTDTNVPTKQQIIGYLLLSSVIGIIIGDILWLQALHLLGSVRVVFMDALKPFCATVFGIVILQEPFHYTILIGTILTVTGIICMSLDGSQSTQKVDAITDRNNDDTHDDADHNVTPIADIKESRTNNDTNNATNTVTLRRHAIGYSFSLINVVLDTYGSVLTKQYGINVSVWEINCIRFGFAGGILLFISIGMILYKNLTKHDCWCYHVKDESDAINIKSNAQLVNAGETTTTTTNIVNVNNVNIEIESTGCCNNSDTAEMKPTMNEIPAPAVPWYMIPIGTKSVWMYISLGVIFVTFVAPTLYNYALFEISLALTLTLTSIGPLYAIPLSYAVQYYVYRSWSNKYEDDHDIKVDMNNNTNDNLRQQQSQGSQPKSKQSNLTKPYQPSKQVWIGAMLTVGGVVVLAYTGVE